jgi:hypothetical protein
MARSLIPNSTQVPDVLIDHWMAELSGAEFKVLLYIARRTYGFGKDRDTISLSQIANGVTKRDGTVLDRGTGASRSSVARCLKELEGRGLIIRTTNMSNSGREFEENTYSINLHCETPSTSGGGGRTDGTGSGEGVVPKSDYLVSQRHRAVSKDAGGWSQNRTTVVSKSDLQETVLQETVQETASAPPPVQVEAVPNADADSLVQELIGRGVGGKVAARLAAQKPDVCRRCLEYLPFADIRTTPGAWLANAIEGEFGPPERFVRAKQESVPDKALSPVPSPKSEEARHAANVERLRVSYAHFEKTQPDALSDFTEFVAAERVKAERFSHQLSERGRADYLEQFENEEHRLSLFERWLNARRKRHPSAPPRAASDALQSAP